VRLVTVCVAVICCFGRVALCTAIVVNIQKGVVTVGSDSKVTNVDGRIKEKPMCKIRQISSRQFVAISSFPVMPDYNAYEIAGSSVQTTGAVATAKRFVAAMEAPLYRTCENVRNTRPRLAVSRRLYEERIKPKKPWISAVFIGFDGKQIEVAREEIVLFEDSGECRVAYTPTTCINDCTKGPALLRLGYHTVPTEQAQQMIWNGNAVLGIKNLIRAEIKANKREVGVPIDILVVTANVGHWVGANKKGCKAIK